MANHGVVIREVPSHDPVNYRSAVAASAIDNGCVVALTGLKTVDSKIMSREVWAAATPSTPAITDELWLVTGVELQYESKKDLADYTNEAGKIFRVERCKDCIMAISKEALTIGTEATDMVAGAAVIATAANKLTLKASAVTNDIVVGTVVEVFTRAGLKFASIQFNREYKKA